MTAVAIGYKENFPVRFNPPEVDSCRTFDKEVYCQPAEQNDRLEFSWVGSQCGTDSGEPLLTCGNFSSKTCANANWLLDGGFNWVWESIGGVGCAVHTPGNDDPLLYGGAANLERGYHKITFTILKNAAGDDIVGGILNAACPTQELIWPEEGIYQSNPQYYESEGTFTFYYNIQPLGNTLNTFGLNPSADFNGAVTNISIVKINTDYKVGLFGLTSGKLVGNLIGQQHLANGAPTLIHAVEDYFIYKGDWHDFGADDGCYKLCMINGCTEQPGNIVVDGTFTNPGVNWNFSALRWEQTYPNEMNVWDNSSPPGGANMYQNIVPTGVCYVLSFQITKGSYNESLIQSGTAFIKWAGVTIVNNTTVYPGWYTFMVTPLPNTIPIANWFDLTFQLDVGLGIRDITLVPCSTLVKDACTGCYDLREDHSCTKLLEWSNNDNAFDQKYNQLPFGGSVVSLTNSLRASVLLMTPHYPEESEHFTFSNGQRKILWANSKKVWDLHIDDLPELMHDAIRIGKIHDVFTIDTISYICLQGDYQPEWRDKMLRAKSVIEVMKGTENNVNYNCE